MEHYRGARRDVNLRAPTPEMTAYRLCATEEGQRPVLRRSADLRSNKPADNEPDGVMARSRERPSACGRLHPLDWLLTTWPCMYRLFGFMPL